MGWPCPWPHFAGLVGGLIRQAIPNKEDLWNLGPFTFLSLPRWLWRLIKKGQRGWEMLPLARMYLRGSGPVICRHATKPQWLFYIDAQNWWSIALLLLATVMAIAVHDQRSVYKHPHPE